jgi:hypothetical protein
MMFEYKALNDRFSCALSALAFSALSVAAAVMPAIS